MSRTFLIVNAELTSGLLKPLVLIFFASRFARCFFPRLSPYGLSVMRRRIGEAFAYDTLHGASGTLNIIYAKPNAIGIAEIELGSVAVQMLFAAMLIDAFHAALENRIIVFDGVGVDHSHRRRATAIRPRRD